MNFQTILRKIFFFYYYYYCKRIHILSYSTDPVVYQNLVNPFYYIIIMCLCVYLYVKNVTHNTDLFKSRTIVVVWIYFVGPSYHALFIKQQL